MQTNLKTCPGCREVKDLHSDFCLDRSKKDGRTSRCRECCRLRALDARSKYTENQKRDFSLKKALRKKAAGALGRERANLLARQRYAENREAERGRNARYRSENRSAIRAQQKIRRAAIAVDLRAAHSAYYNKNKQFLLARNKEWRSKNRDRRAFTLAKRRAALLSRTPSWLSENDLESIKGFYKQAYAASVATGVEHHVDHILPLQGRYVSGLHVPLNLRILTAKQNLSKSNTWMPE